MWDTLSTLAIVAIAVVFIVRRLFLRPHCGNGKNTECHHCPQKEKVTGS
ncbi:MAG: hypothetical protein M0Z78_02110 [Betaproteobacteria bacterium]|nr:hypothetical protein [Betaproteobacteria bacterium]